MRISDWSSDVCSSDLCPQFMGFSLTLKTCAVRRAFHDFSWFRSARLARVTVEDCVDKVTNRFDLVLLAAQRAREISGGAELTPDRDPDKNPVVALRATAEENVQPVGPPDSPLARAATAREGTAWVNT